LKQNNPKIEQLQKGRGMSTEKDTQGLSILSQEYDLVGKRSTETHYYLVQTEVLIRESNGKRKSIDTFSLHLIVEPGNQSSGEADKFTCARFTVKSKDGHEVTIPSLAGWSYEINKQLLDDRALDEHGQLYAIPEEKFKVLIDNTDKKLSFDAAYQVYSAFVYYHSYTPFAEPMEGKGIENLKKIGDKIVLDHSFSEEPIPGEIAAEGSIYKSGEETLEFKGLSVVDDVPCAIIEGDWGECYLTMYIKPMPLMKLKIAGGSHCQFDIYLDLKSFWVKQLTMTLAEMTQVSMFGLPISKTVPLTHLLIKAVGKDKFVQD
jgi:hypothetical protein